MLHAICLYRTGCNSRAKNTQKVGTRELSCGSLFVTDFEFKKLSVNAKAVDVQKIRRNVENDADVCETIKFVWFY